MMSSNYGVEPRLGAQLWSPGMEKKQLRIVLFTTKAEEQS